MSGLIELPEDRELKEEIAILKKEISNLVLRRDELKYKICENIKTKYMLEIGKIEYKVYEIYIKYIRLKRKRDLIQAKLNRKEKISLTEIENKLDEEFLEYKEKLYEKLDDINRALEINDLPVLSIEESKRLKKMYLNIVKKIHPDLNPNLSEEKIELFQLVVDAYKRSDLVALESIFYLLENDEDLSEINDNLNLEEERNRLLKIVDSLEEEIQKIKKSYPYILKVYLEDEDIKLERIEELNYQYASYKMSVEKLEENINSLLRRLDEWFN